MVVDTRAAAEYATGHLPGTLNVPLDDGFTTWAGWLLPYDRDVYLLVGDAGGSPAHGASCVAAAVRDLAMIGLDRVAGVAGPDALAAWAGAGRALEMVAPTTWSSTPGRTGARRCAA